MSGLKNLIRGFLSVFISIVWLGSTIALATAAGIPQMSLRTSEKPTVLLADNGPKSITHFYLPMVRRGGPTPVCGEITADTAWTMYGSPYQVTCDVTVASGVKLTIEAGVSVQFQHTADDLIIYGELRSLGTPYAPIHFQPLSGATRGSWGKVAFLAGSSGLLDHTVLEYGGSSQGMVYIANDTVEVMNSVVQFSSDSGIYIVGASPTISATQILSNTGSSGAGLYIMSGKPIIQNNTISNNIAYGLGLGGGLFDNYGSPIIQNNIFSDNVAAGIPGKYGCSSDPSGGGGIYSYTGNPIIQNNIFSGNRADGCVLISNGGGLYAGGSPIVQNNTFIGNSSQNYGGGMYIYKAIIRNNLVVNNTANWGGGGIYNYGTPTLDYNDVWNNTGGDYSNVLPGAHDISADPLLVDPANGDFHLSASSPCIDAGDPVNYPPTDFEGNPRPLGIAPDIGADEYWGLGMVISGTPAEPLPGDPVTFHVTFTNQTTISITHVLLTDSLPVEMTFISYQAEGFTCTHDGTAWGGKLSCTLGSLSLFPSEYRVLTITVNLTQTFTNPRTVINPVLETAKAGGVRIVGDGQARTRVTWCLSQLNDIPIGKDIQAAIDASSQDTDFVKVSGNCHVHDLHISKAMTLQGGWNRDFTAWAPGIFYTILDGRGMGRVILVGGTVTPTIESFVITGGSVPDVGGGIAVSSGDPIIQDNTFVGNSATRGGGVFNGSGNPIIQENTFTGNSATDGGGLYNDSGAPRIQNNTFTGNSANDGGGLYNDSGAPRIQNNTFTGNSANEGGGLYNYSGNPTIQNNTFTDNTAYYGGGLYNKSGSPTIQENTFTDNISTGRGGGMYTNSGNPTIQTNTFTNNSAWDYGGGLCIESLSATIQNNIFIGNSANGGGGLSTGFGSPSIQNNMFTGNKALEGGGLYNLDGTPNIWNNTFTANSATSIGGGLNNHSGVPNIRSNIVVNNTASSGGGIYNHYGSIILDYNDVWNNTGGDYGNVTPGSHDISADPLLVDPIDGDFHLMWNSPCIDAGDPVNYPPTDFEGDPRPYGPAPDIGADEYHP